MARNIKKKMSKWQNLAFLRHLGPFIYSLASQFTDLHIKQTNKCVIERLWAVTGPIVLCRNNTGEIHSNCHAHLCARGRVFSHNYHLSGKSNFMSTVKEYSNTADRGNGQAAQKDCQIATQTTLDTKNHRGKPTTSRQICEKFSAKPY